MGNGDAIDFPDGIPNATLSIAFGISTGCEFVTGLEMNLAMQFAGARATLKADRQTKAVRKLDRYMRKYSRAGRWCWN